LATLTIAHVVATSFLKLAGMSMGGGEQARKEKKWR
jgi:uncharacterized membrane protein